MRETDNWTPDEKMRCLHYFGMVSDEEMKTSQSQAGTALSRAFIEAGLSAERYRKDNKMKETMRTMFVMTLLLIIGYSAVMVGNVATKAVIRQLARIEARYKVAAVQPVYDAEFEAAHNRIYELRTGETTLKGY